MNFNLIVLAICLVLWYMGGQSWAKWSGFRDVLVPILLGIALMFILPGDWIYRIIAGVGTCACLNVIRTGYGNYEEGEKNSFLAKITHDKNGWWIRALWGLLVGLVAPIFLVLLHYLSLPKYAIFVCLNALIGFSVSRFRFPVLLADICVSLGVSSILFL